METQAQHLLLTRVNTAYREFMFRAEKMQTTLENMPPQLRGDAGEFVLIDELRKEFKTDEIVPKIYGVPIADVVQKIVTTQGEKIPTPLYTTKKWRQM
jgi:hypothetical protein